MNKTRSIMVLVAIALTVSVASATDWPQFQKDKISTGWTTDCAPIHDPPTLAWWKQTSGAGMGGIDVTPIVADGAAYVIDYKGILWSFDAKTGIENWHTSLTTGTGTFEVSTPACNNGIIYAAVSRGDEGVGAGRVCAVYASNGTIREWDYYGLDTFQLNTPITYADGKIYVGNWKGGTVHTEDNGTYYCIDASDVTNEIWNRTAPYVTGYYWAGVAIIGDYVVYGCDRSIVTCLYKDNGTFVDSINVSTTYGIDAKEIRSSIVWNDGYDRIYFSSKGGYAFAIGFDQISGQFDTSTDWDTPYPIGYSTSTPVVYDGRVYVGYGGFGSTGKLYCLNEADGTLAWVTNNLGGVQSSPALSVVGGRKFVYFTVNDANGSAYCIEDLGNGNYNIVWGWNPPHPDDQYILQGVAISKGMVYFGTDYGRIYALAGICGDVNHDGYVDSSDIGLVTQKVSQGAALCSEWAGDANCDGLVDSSDIGLVTQKVSQGTALHCCGCP